MERQSCRYSAIPEHGGNQLLGNLQHLWIQKMTLFSVYIQPVYSLIGYLQTSSKVFEASCLPTLPRALKPNRAKVQGFQSRKTKSLPKP